MGSADHPLICEAIRTCRLLAFDYGGKSRVVAPYCHGTTKSGAVVRAIQVGGEGRPEGFGFGKLWLLAKVDGLRITEQFFVPNDPNYNPNDSAMLSICCRVERLD